MESERQRVKELEQQVANLTRMIGILKGLISSLSKYTPTEYQREPPEERDHNSRKLH